MYNLALAEYLGLSSLKPADWASLAKARGMPASEQPDLFRGALADGTSAPAAVDMADVEEEALNERLAAWRRRTPRCSGRGRSDFEGGAAKRRRLT